MRQPLFVHPLFKIAFAVLTVCFLASCQSPGGTGSGSTPAPPGTSTPPPTPPAPFSVSSIDLVVTPASIDGMTCGSPISLTYTATFHIPAGTAGGTIQFEYTTNNGRSSGSDSVTVSAGETIKTYTFTSSGTIRADQTYPGIGKVWTTSPNAIYSPGVTPSGTCSSPVGPFQVTSIDMAVSPTSIAGLACGSSITLTYTATFHIPAGTVGGTIQFEVSVNNGRSSGSESVTVGPGETTKAYTFTSSGTLRADHTYPGVGKVWTTSPNAVYSPGVIPSGACV